MNLSEKTGKIVETAVVDDTDKIVIITTGGIMLKIRVKEIRSCGRSTQGVQAHQPRPRRRRRQPRPHPQSRRPRGLLLADPAPQAHASRRAGDDADEGEELEDEVEEELEKTRLKPKSRRVRSSPRRSPLLRREAGALPGEVTTQLTQSSLSEAGRLPEEDTRRQLRNSMTTPEVKLWSRLKGGQVFGAKFRRQYSIGPFVRRLLLRAAEAGDRGRRRHPPPRRRPEYDARRERLDLALGLRILRFTNRDVMDNIDGVLEAIASALDQT